MSWQGPDDLLGAAPGGAARTVTLARLADEGRRPVSAKEMEERARALAAALIVYGQEPGGRVAVLADDGGEALLVDLAVRAGGGVLVPLDPSWDDARVQASLLSTGARHALVSNDALLGRILSIRPELPSLDLVLLFRHEGDRPPAAMQVDAACAVGSVRLVEEPTLLARPSGGRTATPACILDLGGGPGAERRLALSHDALASSGGGVAQALDLGGSDVVLSLLPPSDAASLAMARGCLARGACLACARTGEDLATLLREVRPTVVVAPGELLLELESLARSVAGGGSWLKARTLEWALRRGRKRGAPDLAAGRLPSAASWTFRVADRLSLWRIREASGGRLRAWVSLGIPSSAERSAFFYDAGIPLLEAVALPEAAGMIALNLPSGLRPGTAGRALPGIEIAAADGVLRVRGARVISEGWLATSLRGHVDADGFVHVGDVSRTAFSGTAAQAVPVR